MGCAGNPYLETPAMDELAETGVRFERTYCTNPVCSPSRFSLMTGRFPSEIGMRNNRHSHIDTVPSEITQNGIGHLLGDAGYQTAYGGKVHLPKITVEELGFEQLTEDPREGLSDACAEYVKRDHEDPFCLVASFINPHDICYMAVLYMRKARSDYTGPTNPTAERIVSDALQIPETLDATEFWRDECPPLPPNHDPQADEPELIRGLGGIREYARDEWSDEEWRMHRWVYKKLTERVDDYIGQIVDALEESGKRENTVIIFTSDHGDMDGAHKMINKGILYEESARVPLIVSQPGATTAGQVDDSHLISNGLDMLPTICDYAETDAPSELSGMSIRPLAEGRSLDDWREYLRIESRLAEAVLKKEFKYVRYDDGDNDEQLYDLDEDPGETRNVMDQADHQEILNDLRNELERRSQFQ